MDGLRLEFETLEAFDDRLEKVRRKKLFILVSQDEGWGSDDLERGERLNLAIE